jgi:hypothetical protein
VPAPFLAQFDAFELGGRLADVVHFDLDALSGRHFDARRMSLPSCISSLKVGRSEALACAALPSMAIAASDRQISRTILAIMKLRNSQNGEAGPPSRRGPASHHCKRAVWIKIRRPA